MNSTKIFRPYLAVTSCVLACMVVAGQEVSHQTQRPMSERVTTPDVSTQSAAMLAPQTAELMLLDDQARHFSFQALLTNEMGNPIANPNGEHELDFRIYDTDVGGAPVGEILDVLVTLDGGVASTSVGPMVPAWFDGTARWMGVTVDNGSELAPLIALGSVPYALRVDRVASAELDDDIELGDAGNAGSLSVFSGDVTPETITLDGATGALTLRHPTEQGRIILHGTGQIIETRDNNDTLVALYGQDAFGGGGACLLGTNSGTTGLLLDGDGAGNTGGAIRMYNTAAEQTISMTAADATIRAGSIAGGAAGKMHLYPAVGGFSRIFLDGDLGDMRLGFSGESSGDLKLYSTSAGTASIHLNGGPSQVTLTNNASETVTIEGKDANNGGQMNILNNTGAKGFSFIGQFADVISIGQTLNLNRTTNRHVSLAAGGGNVGIGTDSPDHALVIQGNDPTFQIRDDVTDNSENAARIELLEKADGTFNGGAFLWWNGETNKFHIGTKAIGIDTSAIVVDRATSNVGIGTQNPGNHRLAVNGKIRAKEIIVETGWSDFVFEDDYDLPTLEEVEAHISKHGHLKDIPSAKEVAKNGVKVGEMESRLLQKVEELTLHLIAVNKRLQTLECENAQLRGAFIGPKIDSSEAK